MGWEGRIPDTPGPKLADWFDPSPNRIAVERMARRGGERMTELIVANTPINIFPASHPGRLPGTLRRSMTQKLLVVYKDARGDWVAESGTETDDEIASFVNNGTGLWGPKGSKYLISPKKPDGVLHWVDRKTGEDVFARYVMHPGSPGAYMFEIGAAIAEHEFEAIMQPVVVEWARMFEAQINRSQHTSAGRAESLVSR